VIRTLASTENPLFPQASMSAAAAASSRRERLNQRITRRRFERFDRVGGRPAVVPAAGIATLDRKPLAGGFVRLVPEASRVATGRIGPDGRFTLGTFAEADGCVPGTLGVEVIGPLPRGCEMAPVAATPAVTVPDRYRTADTSGLTITVTRATTDLVIALSSDNQPPTTRDWTRSAAVFTRGLLWAGLTRARSAPVGRARRTARVERLRRCQGRAWKATARVQRS